MTSKLSTYLPIDKVNFLRLLCQKKKKMSMHWDTDPPLVTNRLSQVPAWLCGMMGGWWKAAFLSFAELSPVRVPFSQWKLALSPCCLTWNHTLCSVKGSGRSFLKCCSVLLLYPHFFELWLCRSFPNDVQSFPHLFILVFLWPVEGNSSGIVPILRIDLKRHGHLILLFKYFLQMRPF